MFNGATVIGTLSAAEGTVNGGTILNIAFNSDATNSLVQQVVRAISYRTTSNTPSESARTVTFTLTDKDGGTGNDAATISVADLAETGSVSVVNNLAGSLYTGDTDGQLGLTSGAPNVGSSFLVGATPHSLDSITIRTKDGAGSPTYRVNVFNDNGSAAPDYGSLFDTFAAQGPPGTAFGNVVYATNAPKLMTPSARYWVEIQLVTGTQGFVQLEQDTVNTGTAGVFPELGIDINRAGAPSNVGFSGLDLFMQVQGTPTLAPSNANPIIDVDDLNYTESSNPVPIDAAAITIDPDGDADWNGGTLSVQITTNNEATDEISIPDNIVGTINTNGTDLRDGATVIGTLSVAEGTVTGNTALTITFNSAATNVLVLKEA
ncbi:MAG: hypothetical protein ACI9HK_004116 [Pirellulaceae bacterium]